MTTLPDHRICIIQVSRAGILYINPGDLGWNAYVTSWIETRENNTVKANLTLLFDRYIPIMQVE